MFSGKTKSNVISDASRERGNRFFCKKEYFEALSSYNEALRYAEVNSKQLGLAYGNRSAVFLKTQSYKACSENIRLARENNFPSENLWKLIQREKECADFLNWPMEEPWNDFFKLSYQANPNFPYLADCLELKQHERGMLLSTTRALKSGDIIAITEPIFRIPLDSVYRCNYCLADQFMNYIPCPGCVDVMFCNEVCMKKAIAEFHQFECGITDNPTVPRHNITAMRIIMKCVSICGGSAKQFKKIVSRMKNKVATPFDYTLNDPMSVSSQKNLLACHFSVNQRFGCWENEMNEDAYSTVKPFLQRHPKLKELVTLELYNKVAELVFLGDVKTFKSIEGKILSKDNDPGLNFYINYFGAAIDVCFNLFLHSCAPNIFLHPYNGKIVWIVLKPIKAGDWLTASFNDVLFSQRSIAQRKILLPNILCCCQCDACTGNWKPVQSLLMTPIFIMRRSSVVGITEYRKYCDEINDNPRMSPDKLWLIIGNFRWNLYAIGRATFWNQIPFVKLN